MEFIAVIAAWFLYRTFFLSKSATTQADNLQSVVVLLPRNQSYAAKLIQRNEDSSVVYTDRYGKQTVPNHCLRFL
ncbi:MAG: hypothetical protein AAGB12_12990 [Pseudomonadota bacterium]